MPEGVEPLRPNPQAECPAAGLPTHHLSATSIKFPEGAFAGVGLNTYLGGDFAKLLEKKTIFRVPGPGRLLSLWLAGVATGWCILIEQP